MPELVWTDAQYDAPTVPPPRGTLTSLTSVEVPSPRLPLFGSSNTKLEIPRRRETASGRSGVRRSLPPPRRFDPRASAALPLTRRIDLDDSWSAQSSTTISIRETRVLPRINPIDKICILMTQALPLVRVDHSERLERRAIAERAAIVVLSCAALVMTMLALASAVARIVS